MPRDRKDSQLRCPACNALLEEIATKRGLPKYCRWCGYALPGLYERGARRLLTSAKARR